LTTAGLAGVLSAGGSWFSALIGGVYSLKYANLASP
jgi:hypothetical protein